MPYLAQFTRLSCLIYHIRALRQIRNNLSTDTAKTVSCAIVGSRLDYCNLLLHNISKKNIQKLQRIQNNLARVVLQAPRLTSPEPMLASLYWLTVVYRIQYKLAIITFKALTTGQPTYLADLLHRRVAVRHTHSSIPDFLIVPSIRTKDGFTCFQSCCTYHLEQLTSRC